jgi:small conductance mechanosensitive channel
MSVVGDFAGSTVAWLSQNAGNIIYSAMTAIVLFVFYRFSIHQIDKLKKQNRLDKTASFVLKKVFQWGSFLALVAFVVAQFGIKIDLIAGLLVLAGGTVIGFASMNTLGNAIAGLIIMTSRPFKIGDRVFFDSKFADVDEINLIYTRMVTPDNVVISIPNQKLLQTEIENCGSDNIVRRRLSITAGYEEDPMRVRQALLEAPGAVDGVLSSPEPYVWMTDFQNFAMEYTLFIYIDVPQKIQMIEAAVRAAIFESSRRHGIDISTPTIIRSVE